MTNRPPHTKRQQLRDRIAARAERAREAAKLAEYEERQEASRAHGSAREAEPPNVLHEQFMSWNQYMHLPKIWAELAAKPLYAITADEIARLLGDTIRAAAMDKLYEPSALESVARKALPLAAKLEAEWRKYWRQHS